MRRVRTSAGILIAIASIVVLTLPGSSRAEEQGLDAAAANSEVRRGKIELKREATNRGTPDETTKTQLKIEAYLDGFVSFIRLEVPFPDDRQDFEGSPFNPHLGDIKTRVGFRPVAVHGIPISSFVEVTFPTASPQNLGSGKYQLSGGIQTHLNIPLSEQLSQSQSVTFSPLVQQVVSVAGSEDRKNINYTKFELSIRDTWRKRFWLKATVKPVIDWTQDAATGAVAEIEPGWIINRHWSAWLMFGSRLWGEGIPSTYDQRLSLTVAYHF